MGQIFAATGSMQYIAHRVVQIFIIFFPSRKGVKHIAVALLTLLYCQQK